MITLSPARKNPHLGAVVRKSLSAVLVFQWACASEPVNAPLNPAIRSGIGNDSANCLGVYQAGLIAVGDLAGGTYTDPQGGVHPGGLYDTGLNTRPPEIDAVKPTVTAVTNVLGVAFLGGSTIGIPGDSIIAAVKRDKTKNTKVKFANGGVGGHRTNVWASPTATGWTNFAAALSAAGIKPNQLRVVFYMDMASADVETFAGEVNQLASWIDSTITNVKTKYPSVQHVYLTSHHYVGYSGVFDIQEPKGYWNAWSVQQAVRLRAGRADPWTVVGPYVWTNGLGPDSTLGGIPGRSDGRENECLNFEQGGGSSGVHSSPTGATKISTDFMAFLKTDASTSWYRK